MSEETIVSGTNGPHLTLAGMCGSWSGHTRVWFEPGVLADESMGSAEIRPILDGRFVMLEYTGSLQGQPLAGAAILGSNDSDSHWEMAWVDSFHNGTAIMFSRGAAAAGFGVVGSYPDGQGGPDWGWRTEITQPAPNDLILRMYNVMPGSEEALAVETIYTRSE